MTRRDVYMPLPAQVHKFRSPGSCQPGREQKSSPTWLDQPGTIKNVAVSIAVQKSVTWGSAGGQEADPQDTSLANYGGGSAGGNRSIPNIREQTFDVRRELFLQLAIEFAAGRRSEAGVNALHPAVAADKE